MINGMNMKRITRKLIMMTVIVMKRMLVMRTLLIIAFFLMIVMILIIDNAVWLVYPVHNLFHSLQ